MNVKYIDTERVEGLLPSGGLEWMSAGGGAWHKATISGGEVCGLQLWIALPPSQEEGPSLSRYLPPEEVPLSGNVKILLGSLNGVSSPIETPYVMNYFDVTLEPGEKFTYTVPANHTSCLALPYRGTADMQGTRVTRELVVFKDEGSLINIIGVTRCNVVIASSEPHPHDLVAKKGSVHTSQEALRKGEMRIAAIRKELEEDGKL
jgi:redox-sensitive bicupin YhaK (pirin superfamily)